MERVIVQVRWLSWVVLVTPMLSGCIDSQSTQPSSEHAPFEIIHCDEPCLRLIDGETSQWWEPDASVNPLDPLHLVVAASSIGGDPVGRVTWWDYTHVSRDGGLTWRSARFPGGPEAGPNHPLFAYDMLGDPVVAFLPDGTLVHATLAGVQQRPTIPADAVAYARTGMDLVVARSSDGGLTYPADDIRVVASGQGLQTSAYAGSPADESVSEYVLLDWHDKPWFDVGPNGEILLAWSELIRRNPLEGELEGRTDTLAAYSPDGGRSWTQPVTILRGPYALYAAPVILDDRIWAVAFLVALQDGGPDAPTIAFSNDRGKSWETQRLAENASPFGLALKVQPRPDGNRLLLLYARQSDTDAELLVPTLLWSDDHGATWGGPLDLDVPEASGLVLPALDVGPDGLAWATYLHPYVEGDERRAELRAVLIGDGAVSEPFVVDSGVHRTVGHYLGLAAFPGGAFAAWPGHDGDTNILMGSSFLVEDPS